MQLRITSLKKYGAHVTAHTNPHSRPRFPSLHMLHITASYFVTHLSHMYHRLISVDTWFNVICGHDLNQQHASNCNCSWRCRTVAFEKRRSTLRSVRCNKITCATECRMGIAYDFFVYTIIFRNKRRRSTILGEEKMNNHWSAIITKGRYLYWQSVSLGAHSK
jgi:hypothetical protein